MRQDVIIAARAAGCALGVLVLYACSTPADQNGSTSPAPAATGENSSASAPAPPAEPDATHPQPPVTTPR
ncbi:MAG TPA: hypothetical protein VFE18_16075 [Phenylobacterium sp.]|jgi:hypothetical protein|uniref:hypothetical protein n=1 Tax=Phenylobacterium sp. TaxID=1871053 RepID=UPI002D2D63CF|nr:hypothetical protein [Phenylobacterium sp.]HZZ69690.1 hypothetical protein [Phenylobacterium sp.]